MQHSANKVHVRLIILSVAALLANMKCSSMALGFTDLGPISYQAKLASFKPCHTRPAGCDISSQCDVVCET